MAVRGTRQAARGRPYTRALTARAEALTSTHVAKAIRLPNLNLRCNIWRAINVPAFPPVAPPDIANLPCQLYAHKGNFSAGYLATFGGFMELRVAKQTPLHPGTTSTGDGDVVECPAGTGRFYRLKASDDAHRGFANEYRFAIMQQAVGDPGGWPVPSP